MDRKDKETIILNLFKEELNGVFPFKQKCKTKFTKALGGYTFTFIDKTIVSVFTDSVSGSYPKDCFGITSVFTVYEGPVLDLFNTAGYNVITKGKQIIMGNSINTILKMNAADYKFLEDTDIEAVTKELCRDIVTYYSDYMVAFVDDYPRAIDFLIRDESFDHLTVNNPFATGVALMKLAGDFSRLDELIAKAKTKTKFYDFHKVENYRRDIIEVLSS